MVFETMIYKQKQINLHRIKFCSSYFMDTGLKKLM